MTPYRSLSSSASFKGCCCFFLLFSFLVLLVLAIVLVIILAVKPKKPQFDLQQVGVQYMGINSPNRTTDPNPASSASLPQHSPALLRREPQQAERVLSNWTKFVMALWIFAVLVLTVSYTASLTSIYTIEQVGPIVTVLNDLLTSGHNIGHAGFHESKLQHLKTMEEIDDALSKGSANGRVAAVVDETPSMKLFLAKYCNKYAMSTRPLFKTDGLAFVFPKRSPLLPDISQAILNVTGRQKIMDIENKWFREHSNCQDSGGPDSFLVIFLIVGVVSMLALIIRAVSFVNKHKDVWDSEASLYSRFWVMWNIFKEEEPNCDSERQDVVVGSSNNSRESSVTSSVSPGSA